MTAPSYRFLHLSLGDQIGRVIRKIEDSGLGIFRLHSKIPEDTLRDFRDQIVSEFRLNMDQARLIIFASKNFKLGGRSVIDNICCWFLPPNGGYSPVTLVWGPFGTGKSTLLVAVVVFLSRVVLRRLVAHILICPVCSWTFVKTRKCADLLNLKETVLAGSHCDIQLDECCC